jgi:hypothetical protein
MPRRHSQVVILLLWGVSTSWFVKQELGPLWVDSAGTYRALTWQRAVDETTRWRITSGKQTIGSASTRVQPAADGTHRIRGILTFDKLPQATPDAEVSAGNSIVPRGIHVELDLAINAVGRLTSVDCGLSILDTHLNVSCLGRVAGDRIRFRVKGLEEIPAIPREFDYPFHSETAYWEDYAPRDRLSGLKLGHVWSTRSANPLARLPGPLQWLVGGAAESVVTHEVVSVETLSFQGQTLSCFVVEHRQQAGTNRSWVATEDGRVLRHEFRFIGRQFTLHRLADSN